jgi:hypothetical protein
MRSPVQIWLAAPKSLESKWIQGFFAFILLRAWYEIGAAPGNGIKKYSIAGGAVNRLLIGTLSCGISIRRFYSLVNAVRGLGLYGRNLDRNGKKLYIIHR